MKKRPMSRCVECQRMFIEPLWWQDTVWFSMGMRTADYCHACSGHSLAFARQDGRRRAMERKR